MNISLSCRLLLVFLFFVASSVRAQTQGQLLQSAYTSRSEKKLELFLKRWALDSKTTASRLPNKANDTLKAMNEVYQAFYLSENSYLLDTQYRAMPEVSYVVLNDSLQLALADTMLFPGEDPLMMNVPDREVLREILWQARQREQVVKKYYPVFHMKNTKVLSLTYRYHQILQQFLSKPVAEKDHSGHFFADRSHDEEKARFLGRYLVMNKGHWGEYWHYLSNPRIGRIVLDKKLSRAVIAFDRHASGGVAYLEKENGKWRVVTSEIVVSQ